MDFVSSIFPFDQLCELLDFSPAPDNMPPEPSQKRNFTTAFDHNIDDDNARDQKKHLIHSDVERQRRQETARLRRSLRSLLPIECLKGKRAIADHLHETVGYIRQLRQKIQDLIEKREKLKQLMNYQSSPSGATEYSLPVCRETNVTVETSRAGIQVVVSTAFTGGLKLSKVLRILSKEGLSITSCSSTKVGGRLLYTIESEVDERRSIDSGELQKKLTKYCVQNKLIGGKDA